MRVLIITLVIIIFEVCMNTSNIDPVKGFIAAEAMEDFNLQQQERTEKKEEVKEKKFTLDKEAQAADEKKQEIKSQDEGIERGKAKQMTSNPYGI